MSRRKFETSIASFTEATKETSSKDDLHPQSSLTKFTPVTLTVEAVFGSCLPYRSSDRLLGCRYTTDLSLAAVALKSVVLSLKSPCSGSHLLIIISYSIDIKMVL